MDPISDMLIRIKNAARAKKTQVFVPYSNFKYEIASVLMRSGYFTEAQRKTKKSGKHSMKQIELKFAYKDGEPNFHDVRRISKPSRRLHKPQDKIFPVKSGYGMAIISTSKGVMTDADARKAGVGGEIIAEIW